MSRGVAAYKNNNLETKIINATPKELVSMLYEGVIRNLISAKGHMERGQVAEKGIKISKSIEIINHLITTLDLEKGGEVSENMLALYDYSNRLLLKANLENDSNKLNEVIGIIKEIKEGWDSII